MVLESRITLYFTLLTQISRRLGTWRSSLPASSCRALSLPLSASVCLCWPASLVCLQTNTNTFYTKTNTGVMVAHRPTCTSLTARPWRGRHIRYMDMCATLSHAQRSAWNMVEPRHSKVACSESRQRQRACVKAAANTHFLLRLGLRLGLRLWHVLTGTTEISPIPCDLPCDTL
jgi:hypothetical protein